MECQDLFSNTSPPPTDKHNHCCARYLSTAAVYKEKHEYYLNNVEARTFICLGKNDLISENAATVLQSKRRTNNANNTPKTCTDLISYVSFLFILVTKARIFSNPDTISIDTGCLCCKWIINRPVGKNVILQFFWTVLSKTINKELRSII